MKRRGSGMHLPLLIAAVMFAAWRTVAQPAEAVTTGDKVRAFLGGKKATLTYLSGDMKSIYAIDLGENDISSQVVVSGSSIDERPKLSLDGKRVAYVAGGKAYVKQLTGGEEQLIGDAEAPITWWIHPSTKAEYVVYPKTTRTMDTDKGIWMRRVSSDGAPMGSETKVFETHYANAGRSADGRFFGSQQQAKTVTWKNEGSGIYELKPSSWTAVENAQMLTRHSMAVYCNGALSPAGPHHEFYGHLCFLSTGHTELFVRRFRDDAVAPFDVVNHNVARSGEAMELFPGRTEFHAPAWATDPRFIALAVIRDRQSKGTGNACIFDLHKAIELKASGGDLREAFITVAANGARSPHLWVEGGEEAMDVDRSPTRREASPPRHLSSGRFGGHAVLHTVTGGESRGRALLDSRGRTISPAASRAGRGSHSLLPDEVSRGVLFIR